MSLLGIVRRHHGAALGAPNQSPQEKLALELCGTMAAIPPHGLNLPIQAFLNQGFGISGSIKLISPAHRRNTTETKKQLTRVLDISGFWSNMAFRCLSLLRKKSQDMAKRSASNSASPQTGNPSGAYSRTGFRCNLWWPNSWGRVYWSSS
jgi:hypothetical protein